MKLFQVFGAATIPPSALTSMAARGMHIYLDRPLLPPVTIATVDPRNRSSEERDYLPPPLSSEESDEIRRIMVNHSAIDNSSGSRSNSPPSYQVSPAASPVSSSRVFYPSIENSSYLSQGVDFLTVL